jgi:hypothetical protein
MRTLTAELVLLLLAIPSLGQSVGDLSVGDSVSVEDALLQPNPKYSTNYLEHFGEATPAQIVDLGRGHDYIRIKIEGKKGWVEEGTLSPIASYRKQRERRREAEDLRRQLRRKGYTVVIVAQTFEKNSAGGIDIGLGFINISETKTIKYATATWQLHNPVGDPVEKGLDSSTAKTRFVGPLEPEGIGRSTFENVWYSNVGSCAELKKLVVEHIDGSSFTYVNDLKEIAQLSESVRLDGDCSYEAQQKREN